MNDIFSTFNATLTMLTTMLTTSTSTSAKNFAGRRRAAAASRASLPAGAVYTTAAALTCILMGIVLVFAPSGAFAQAAGRTVGSTRGMTVGQRMSADDSPSIAMRPPNTTETGNTLVGSDRPEEQGGLVANNGDMLEFSRTGAFYCDALAGTYKYLAIKNALPEKRGALCEAACSSCPETIGVDDFKDMCCDRICVDPLTEAKDDDRCDTDYCPSRADVDFMDNYPDSCAMRPPMGVKPGDCFCVDPPQKGCCCEVRGYKDGGGNCDCTNANDDHLITLPGLGDWRELAEKSVFLCRVAFSCPDGSEGLHMKGDLKNDDDDTAHLDVTFCKSPPGTPDFYKTEFTDNDCPDTPDVDDNFTGKFWTSYNLAPDGTRDGIVGTFTLTDPNCEYELRFRRESNGESVVKIAQLQTGPLGANAKDNTCGTAAWVFPTLVTNPPDVTCPLIPDANKYLGDINAYLHCPDCGPKCKHEDETCWTPDKDYKCCDGLVCKSDEESAYMKVCKPCIENAEVAGSGVCDKRRDCCDKDDPLRVCKTYKGMEEKKCCIQDGKTCIKDGECCSSKGCVSWGENDNRCGCKRKGAMCSDGDTTCCKNYGEITGCKQFGSIFRCQCIKPSDECDSTAGDDQCCGTGYVCTSSMGGGYTCMPQGGGD